MNLVTKILESVYFQAWIGALCSHMLSLNIKEFQGTIPFLKKLFPLKSDTFYFRMDFLVLPLIGALLASVLLDPIGFKSSLFAGISWSGTLIALLKRNNNQISNTQGND
jgi:hypothetical protein